MATLRRTVGPLQLTLYGLGSMLGSGIYGLIGQAAGQTGNAVWLAFLVAMVAALLSEAGESADVIDRAIEGDLKSQPMEALAGRTPRYTMQTLGTEWGRGAMASDIWVRLAIMRANRLRAEGVAVIVDDMRFLNEARAIQEAGGKLVRITRPDAARLAGHASEGALDDFRFDMEVSNTQASALAFGLNWASPVSAFGWR
jgi:hypothetical protein